MWPCKSVRLISGACITGDAYQWSVRPTTSMESEWSFMFVHRANRQREYRLLPTTAFADTADDKKVDRAMTDDLLWF